MSNIFSASEEWRRRRDELLAEFPDLADDVEALNDTADGEVDFDLAVRSMIRSAWLDEAFAEAIDSEIERYAERGARYRDRAARKVEIILTTMTACDRRKLTLPECTITVTDRRASVVITDEKQIPVEYYKTKEPAISKTLIKEALDAGKVVPGATLSNGGVQLNVRRK